MVRSVYVLSALLGAAAAAPVAVPASAESKLVARCVPDDPTPCDPNQKRDVESVVNNFEEEVSNIVSRCIPDDPTSCSPEDFGKRDFGSFVKGAEEKADQIGDIFSRCIPDDPTSCGAESKRDFGSFVEGAEEKVDQIGDFFKGN